MIKPKEDFVPHQRQPSSSKDSHPPPVHSSFKDSKSKENIRSLNRSISSAMPLKDPRLKEDNKNYKRSISTDSIKDPRLSKMNLVHPSDPRKLRPTTSSNLTVNNPQQVSQKPCPVVPASLTKKDNEKAEKKKVSLAEYKKRADLSKGNQANSSIQINKDVGPINDNNLSSSITLRKSNSVPTTTCENQSIPYSAPTFTQSLTFSDIQSVNFHSKPQMTVSQINQDLRKNVSPLSSASQSPVLSIGSLNNSPKNAQIKPRSQSQLLPLPVECEDGTTRNVLRGIVGGKIRYVADKQNLPIVNENLMQNKPKNLLVEDVSVKTNQENLVRRVSEQDNEEVFENSSESNTFYKASKQKNDGDLCVKSISAKVIDKGNKSSSGCVDNISQKNNEVSENSSESNTFHKTSKQKNDVDLCVKSISAKVIDKGKKSSSDCEDNILQKNNEEVSENNSDSSTIYKKSREKNEAHLLEKSIPAKMKDKGQNSAPDCLVKVLHKNSEKEREDGKLYESKVLKKKMPEVITDLKPSMNKKDEKKKKKKLFPEKSFGEKKIKKFTDQYTKTPKKVDEQEVTLKAISKTKSLENLRRNIAKEAKNEILTTSKEQMKNCEELNNKSVDFDSEIRSINEQIQEQNQQVLHVLHKEKDQKSKDIDIRKQIINELNKQKEKYINKDSFHEIQQEEYHKKDKLVKIKPLKSGEWKTVDSTCASIIPPLPLIPALLEQENLLENKDESIKKNVSSSSWKVSRDVSNAKNLKPKCHKNQTNMAKEFPDYLPFLCITEYQPEIVLIDYIKVS